MATSSGKIECSYTESLSSTDRASYLKKLFVDKGGQLPDPYGLPKSEWMEDMELWPGLQWPDIYLYLINTPSVYTKENLKAYKSLEAVNFVLCGHVQKIRYHQISSSSEFCVVRADVLPSQRQGHKTDLYDAWVIIHKHKNYILTANCTCLAGLASCCSHAAAVMCKIELGVRLGFTSKEDACTSQKCKWKDLSRKKVNPCRLGLINFSRPKREFSELPTKKCKTLRTDIQEINESDVEELRTIFPQAAVLTSVECGSTDSDTDTASESESSALDIPEPLTSLYQPGGRTLSPTELKSKSSSAYSTVLRQATIQCLENLENVTRDQAECQTWHVHRIGRVTGSIFHSVNTSNATRLTSVMKQVMKYDPSDLSHIPAVKWGKEMEAQARMSYKNFMSKNHAQFTLRTAGLFVKHEEPFLAASPDGISSCSCCGRGVLEIKCPYKYRNGLTGSQQDASFCLDGQFVLRNTHKYYSQVQLQMYVCNVDFCDLFIWTLDGEVLCRVQKDMNFLAGAVKKTSNLFFSHILPELITRSQDPSIDKDQLCFSCERPYFGKIIKCQQCGNSYHYECVHINRAPKTWLCNECRQLS